VIVGIDGVRNNQAQERHRKAGEIIMSNVMISPVYHVLAS
jgi:hypothetical protein